MARNSLGPGTDNRKARPRPGPRRPVLEGLPADTRTHSPNLWDGAVFRCGDRGRRVLRKELPE